MKRELFLLKVKELDIENGTTKWQTVRRQKREWIKFAAACREGEDNSRRNPIARVSDQINRSACWWRVLEHSSKALRHPKDLQPSRLHGHLGRRGHGASARVAETVLNITSGSWHRTSVPEQSWRDVARLGLFRSFLLFSLSCIAL